MLESFKNWLARPFSNDMDALHWFLFYGLMLVIAATWAMILKAVKE